MAALRGPRRNSWTLCGGTHGDVGNLIGLRRKTPGQHTLLARAKDANGVVQT